jgi:hypothetical protein
MSRFSKAGAAGDSDLKKQLKIKTGTLKRFVEHSALLVLLLCSLTTSVPIPNTFLSRSGSLSAELKMYTTEKLQVEAKLEKLTAAESDAHDRKKVVRL